MLACVYITVIMLLACLLLCYFAFALLLRLSPMSCLVPSYAWYKWKLAWDTCMQPTSNSTNYSAVTTQKHKYLTGSLLSNWQDGVTVVGYPLGGDTISVTKGVVSRIEVCSFHHVFRFYNFSSINSMHRSILRSLILHLDGNHLCHYFMIYAFLDKSLWLCYNCKV